MVCIRGLFCPSCLARDRDRATSSESLSPANEALATAAPTTSDRSSPIDGSNDDEVEQSDQQLAASLIEITNNAGQQPPLSNVTDNSQSTNSNSSQQLSVNVQPPASQPSIYRESSSQLPNQHLQQQQQQSLRNNESAVAANQNGSPNDGDAFGEAMLLRTRLSYDIISVREPLARVLEERQRQQHQLQRRPTSDHDYNEVYNERGASCFYEEIAGSTTSSTTYDQIDGASNHNYQALRANTYAVVNRADQLQPRRIERDARNEENNGDSNYDLISGPDYSQPSNSRNVSALESTQAQQQDRESNGADDDDLNCLVQTPTQSIPIYSVINKATKVSNMGFNFDDPPQPPPKNFNHQKKSQASTGGTSVPFHEEPRTLSDQFEQPNNAQDVSFGCGDEDESPVPRPPTTARYHHRHQHIFNVTHRPLPPPTSESPSSLDKNCSSASDRNSKRTDCDFKSDDNGYEFLRHNYYDDQIDVGYEKINDPDQHSCIQPASDNGGYESLQPIYASPAYADAPEPANEDDITELASSSAIAKHNTNKQN